MKRKLFSTLKILVLEVLKMKGEIIEEEGGAMTIFLHKVLVRTKKDASSVSTPLLSMQFLVLEPEPRGRGVLLFSKDSHYYVFLSTFWGP